MATDNKQKVLIRSMSYNELENYLCTNDLNGKITPKNEDTWHQNYDSLSENLYRYVASIIQNTSKLTDYFIFVNRYIWEDTVKYKEINRSTNNFVNFLWDTGVHIQGTPVFRPLIEYKE